jgi:hypothetical protein
MSIQPRRIAQNNLVWQTPPLATAAQAVLLAAAFNAAMGTAEACLLFGFSFFVGLASIQLMNKHRHHELVDSRLLARFESEHAEEDYSVLHGPGGPIDLVKRNWLVRIKSFELWIVVLAGFCAVSLYGLYLKL